MKRLQITVIGCVQGVGFRPFIYRLANQYQLTGSIRNTTLGVEIIVQGNMKALSDFQKDIPSLKPERASITQIIVLEKPLQNFENFEIKGSSTSSETELALLPDTALCPTCFEEFSDPKNRRYRYPFVH